MEPYARLKRQLRYSTHGAALRIHFKRPHAYRPSPTLTGRSASAYNLPCSDPT